MLLLAIAGCGKAQPGAATVGKEPGAWQKPADILDAAVENEPNNPLAYLARGRAFLVAGNPHLAGHIH